MTNLEDAPRMDENMSTNWFTINTVALGSNPHVHWGWGETQLCQLIKISSQNNDW
jgi:hypothetical protein